MEIKKLQNQIYSTVKLYCRKDIVGIAFSGGVDSSILAKVCNDLGKDVKLLTIGFKSSKDIEASEEISDEMGLPLYIHYIKEGEFEWDVKSVLSLIGFQSLTRFENALAFYYTAMLAKKNKIKTILSANGLDELYCGYHRYTEIIKNDGEIAVVKEIKKLVKKAKSDKGKIDRVVRIFNIEKIDPFLSDDFIEYSLHIPVNEKLKKDDGYKGKVILRKVALEIGVPKAAALRPKKAFQYGSKIHNRLQKLAKKRVFKGGSGSSLEIYFKELTHSD